MFVCDKDKARNDRYPASYCSFWCLVVAVVKTIVEFSSKSLFCVPAQTGETQHFMKFLLLKRAYEEGNFWDLRICVTLSALSLIEIFSFNMIQSCIHWVIRWELTIQNYCKIVLCNSAIEWVSDFQRNPTKSRPILIPNNLRNLDLSYRAISGYAAHLVNTELSILPLGYCRVYSVKNSGYFGSKLWGLSIDLYFLSVISYHHMISDMLKY